MGARVDFLGSRRNTAPPQPQLQGDLRDFLVLVFHGNKMLLVFVEQYSATGTVLPVLVVWRHLRTVFVNDLQTGKRSTSIGPLRYFQWATLRLVVVQGYLLYFPVFQGLGQYHKVLEMFYHTYLLRTGVQRASIGGTRDYLVHPTPYGLTCPFTHPGRVPMRT